MLLEETKIINVEDSEIGILSEVLALLEEIGAKPEVCTTEKGEYAESVRVEFRIEHTLPWKLIFRKHFSDKGIRISGNIPGGTWGSIGWGEDARSALKSFALEAKKDTKIIRKDLQRMRK